MTDKRKIEKAMSFIVEYGGIDGAHHKDWVLDQAIRILAGEEYKEIVRLAKLGVDGPDTYSWDVGIAP